MAILLSLLSKQDNTPGMPKEMKEPANLVGKGQLYVLSQIER